MWEEMNLESSSILEKLCNERIRLNNLIEASTLTFSDESMIASDKILFESESISMYLSKFSGILESLQRHAETLPSLLEISQTLDSVRFPKIRKFAEIIPFVLETYKSELSFKLDSFEDISVTTDTNLYSSILTSWKFGIYTNLSLTSLLYSFALWLFCTHYKV